MSYDYAAQNGFEFVVGVANANSYPGFIKYFDFQDIGMLEVLIGSRKGIETSYKDVDDRKVIVTFNNSIDEYDNNTLSLRMLLLIVVAL